MATILELINQVGYELGELPARNAHHAFEHLCRHLARARLCSNILPATGPVSAGGDQGRDFETFRIHLASVSASHSTSIYFALVSERRLAFACSLQKTIVPKIRADVATIAGSGDLIDEIHYFCTANFPVARRHELQNWARESHGVHVEIYDRQAIAELLVDREVFWIASQFLGVPADMFPMPPLESSEEWYSETRAAWQSGEGALLTFSGFAMVKSAVRHATAEPALASDLPMWLDALSAFEVEDVAEPLRFRSTYERAVASLRALRTMEGLEDRLRRYFDAVPGFARVADLEDASCLAVFCHEANHRHVLGVGLDEVFAWRDIVATEVERRLANAVTTGERAELLALRGHLEVALGLGREPGPETAREVVGSTVGYWLQAANLAEKSPLFPLERFADQMSKLAFMIGDDPRYGALIGRVDDLLARRVGDAAVAGKARDRAVAFHSNGRVLRAVAELHEANVRWFARETLEGSVLAMLFVAGCYRDLGLNYASKYYALAASHRAAGSDDPDVLQLVPRALIVAGECDYVQGNWIGFLGLTDLAVTAHWQLARQPGDFDANPELEGFGMHSAVAVAVCERIDGRLAARFAEIVASWGALSWLDEILPAARQGWHGVAPEDAVSRVEEQLHGRLLGDVEPEREVAWEQLGVTWRVRWSNLDPTSRAAEQLVALLQIGLTDFADHDLLLLRTEIRIEASTADVPEAVVEPIPSNDGRRWRVLMPTAATQDGEGTWRRSVWTFGIAIGILREVSLLPEERFQEVLAMVVQKGALAKVLVGRSYEQLAREFSPNPSLLESLLLRPVPRARPTPVVPAHPELAWIGHLGPGYSEEAARKLVARRYQHAARTLPLTLARLRQSAEFRLVAEELRTKGWKDWHLLLAVGNLTWNYRGSHLYGPHGLADRAIANQLVYQVEGEDALPVPTNEYGMEAMRSALQMSMISTLHGWELEIHQETPDLPAIEQFLALRYRYWDVDVVHVDPLLGDDGSVAA